ncbi:MAG: hypothetical protein N2170_09550 [Bacteroidia bacterium]|nr:hypothetical protein [Bacteroidia bacterium]
MGVIIYNKDCHRLEWWNGAQWIAAVTDPPVGGSTLPAPTATPPTGVSSTGFTATWAAVSGATAYELVVSTDSNFGTLLAGYPISTQNTSYAISNLSCGTYYYRVRAFGGPCRTTSPWSNTVRVRLSALPPCPGPDSWVALPSPPAGMPGRNNQIAVSLNGKIYMGFGDNQTGCLNDWWEWDTCLGWTLKSSPPSVIGGLAFAFVIGNYIYVGGADIPAEGLLRYLTDTIPLQIHGQA